MGHNLEDPQTTWLYKICGLVETNVVFAYLEGVQN